MSSRIGWLLLLALPGLFAAPASAVAPRPHLDRLGDPLPDAAVARLGSSRFRAGGPIHSLAVSPDGRLLASGTDGDVLLMDSTTGRRLRVLRGPHGVREFIAVAFSRDGCRVVGGARSGHLGQWDAATGKALRLLEVSEEFLHVAWAPDGRRAVAIGRSGTADVWDLTRGKHLLDLAGKVLGYGVAFHGHTPDRSCRRAADDRYPDAGSRAPRPPLPHRL
jgi:WD40 repeat protein